MNMFGFFLISETYYYSVVHTYHMYGCWAGQDVVNSLYVLRLTSWRDIWNSSFWRGFLASTWVPLHTPSSKGHTSIHISSVTWYISSLLSHRRLHPLPNKLHREILIAVISVSKLCTASIWHSCRTFRPNRSVYSRQMLVVFKKKWQHP